MTQAGALRTTTEAVGMNRNATAALTLLLASAATLVIWQLGWNGPTYARVLSARPVSVLEPRYVDVVSAVPVAGIAGQPAAWDVVYRQGLRVLHARLPARPGDQIRIGEQRRVIGYDVVWRWRERTGLARVSRRPGNRLPVADGAVLETRRPLPLSS
jgi:uncharacterized protein YcfJ